MLYHIVWIALPVYWNILNLLYVKNIHNARPWPICTNLNQTIIKTVLIMIYFINGPFLKIQFEICSTNVARFKGLRYVIKYTFFRNTVMFVINSIFKIISSFCCTYIKGFLLFLLQLCYTGFRIIPLHVFVIDLNAPRTNAIQM